MCLLSICIEEKVSILIAVLDYITPVKILKEVM